MIVRILLNLAVLATAIIFIVTAGIILFSYRKEIYCYSYYKANILCDRIEKWTGSFYEKYYNYPDYADRKLYIETCMPRKRKVRR